jgi:DNA-binding PadR family transcriptional regulator
MSVKISSDLLRGHTDTIVLGILQNADSYGYEIYKIILEKTQEQFELKEATLYSSIRRLEQEGCISAYWGDETQGGRRKYYKMNEQGKLLLAQNKADWAFTKIMLGKLLEEE